MKWTVTLIVLLAALPLFAQSDSDDAVQAKIIALEKAWNQAYKLGDGKALGGLLDDGIVLIEDDGSMKTKGAFLASLKSATANEEQVAPESLTVRVFGKTAIAVGVFAAKGTKGGKPYVRRERFVDTWILKNGNWVCVATNATPMTH
ncbi:MAG TPA: nuclear transport factor 2 family protein [Terriglobales bacterium]|nr:nuclear transport factor 2 family protein [Terriglobales bacterium]